MKNVIRAALVYFAMVFSAGFVMGAVRVPILVPRMGERWAELAEMPIMAAVIFIAAGYVLRRFPEIRSRGSTLAAGFLALALLVVAELALAVMLQDQTLLDYINGRDKLSGSVYLCLLLVFALMLLLRSPKRAPQGCGEDPG